MKSRTFIFVIFGVIMLMTIMVLWSNLARGQELLPKTLTKQEQTKLMIECIEDARSTCRQAAVLARLNDEFITMTRLASYETHQMRVMTTLAFFQYRTKDR